MGSAELLSRCEQAVQHYPIKEFKDAAARDGLEHHNSRETVFADVACSATEANRAAHG